MSDTIPTRSHVDRNIASEPEDPVLHEFPSNEHDFGTPCFMESATNRRPTGGSIDSMRETSAGNPTRVSKI
ncbi:hypothetical protein RRF57_011521 [Xylaria bambusicola]|uniref:Uncharacterized protein n=1 Tax=Xylaria bambusicola TaxID=326684 RepID=A0AAN7V4P2_9PEZI